MLFNDDFYYLQACVHFEIQLNRLEKSEKNWKNVKK